MLSVPFSRPLRSLDISKTHFRSPHLRDSALGTQEDGAAAGRESNAPAPRAPTPACPISARLRSDCIPQKSQRPALLNVMHEALRGPALLQGAGNAEASGTWLCCSRDRGNGCGCPGLWSPCSTDHAWCHILPVRRWELCFPDPWGYPYFWFSPPGKTKNDIESSGAWKGVVSASRIWF